MKEWHNMRFVTDDAGTAMEKLTGHCNKYKITPGEVVIIETTQTSSSKKGELIVAMIYE